MSAYSVLFLDPGGEYYFSLGLSAAGVWTGGQGGGGITSSAPAGRATQYAINLASVTRNFSNYQSWIVGCAMYTTNFPASSSQPLISFSDTGTAQCDLRVSPTGALLFTRNGTQIGSTSTNLLVPNAWYYIEAKAFIASGTSGSMEVRVNGVVWLTVSSVSTQNTANAYANQVKFAVVASGSFQNTYVKDMYVMADTGSGPNSTYLGDITVAVNYPNGAGVNQQWTQNGGSSQTNDVQDGITHSGTWPDGDTTYISDATAGHISDFAHQSLSLTGSILAVVHASYMRKDDAGSRAVRQVCLSGATTEDNGSDISLGNTYQYYYDVIEKDPNTSAAWTLANYNAATFGVKEIS